MKMKWKAIRSKPKKHIPSGIIIAFMGADNKVHTQSIAIAYPMWPKESSKRMTLINANTELMLCQLDRLAYPEYKTRVAPVITFGLSRADAKVALLESIEQKPALPHIAHQVFVVALQLCGVDRSKDLFPYVGVSDEKSDL